MEGFKEFYENKEFRKKRKTFATTLGVCQICKNHRPLSMHHYKPGAYRRDNDNKTIQVCNYCHSDLHALPCEKFQAKYKKEKCEFLYCKMNPCAKKMLDKTIEI